jgi:hypothetical protein
MKWMILTFALLASAYAEDLVENEGDARLGYITVGDSGATTLTFNATSIQNAVILGLFILVLGALVLPLFGVSMGDYLGEESGSGYGYGYEQPAYSEYDQSAYSTYSKRSIQEAAPILAALQKKQDQYQ